MKTHNKTEVKRKINNVNFHQIYHNFRGEGILFEYFSVVMSKTRS